MPVNPDTRRILLLLAQGQQLVRGPQGWRVILGAGFERVDTAAVREALAASWVAPAPGTPGSIAWVLTEAGRKALETPP